MGIFDASPFNTQLFGGPGAFVGAPAGSVSVGDDIIYSALRIIRVLGAPQRGASNPEIQDGLEVVNSLLDALNIERMFIWAVQRCIFPLVAGQAVYSIGTQADADALGITVDFDRPRPARIEYASMILLNNPQAPLELPMVPLDYFGWQSLPLKNTPSSLATNFYYDQANPIGHIHLFPVPNVANLIALYLWQTLAQFTSKDERVFLPPGCLRMLQYNLAVELASRFKQSVLTEKTVEIADESKRRFKSINKPPLDMICDPATLGSSGRYNFYTDNNGPVR